jgi:membrane peptidoglycan carboxypeptidase
MLTDILKGAVHPSMGFPVAAKSGTTTDFKDAWYMGYTSDLAVASWMGRTVSQPTPHNESMNGLWGEIGPAASWRQFMKAYYGSKKPADWARPAEVAPLTLCKLSGQPAPVDVAPENAIQDLALKPDPALPVAACGVPATAGSAPAGVAGLPGMLPSVPPLPSPSPPIVH